MFSLGRFAPLTITATASFGTFDFATITLTPQDLTGSVLVTFDFAAVNLTPQDGDGVVGPLLVDFDAPPSLTFTAQNLQVPVSSVSGTFDFATLLLAPQDFVHLVSIMVGWPGDVVMLGDGRLNLSTDQGTLNIVMGTSGKNYAEVLDDGTGS